MFLKYFATRIKEYCARKKICKILFYLNNRAGLLKLLDDLKPNVQFILLPVNTISLL